MQFFPVERQSLLWVRHPARIKFKTRVALAREPAAGFAGDIDDAAATAEPAMTTTGTRAMLVQPT